MKKWGKIALILLSVTLLQACQQQKEATKESTKDKDQVTSSLSRSSTEATAQTSQSTSRSESSASQTNTAATSSSQAPASSSSSSNNSSSTATSSTAQNQSTTSFFATLKESFPHDPLPSGAIVANPTGYTAATTSAADQNNFRILYYQDANQIPINDPRVNQLTPVASFAKQTFATEEAAYQYAAGVKADGMAIDLGHGIKGYQQGAAGSTYIGWQEGNWNLLVRSSNVQGEDGVSLSKAAVAVLEEVLLPAPNRTGKVTLQAHTGDYQTNTIVWQKGNVVYVVTNQQAEQALRMAASVK